MRQLSSTLDEFSGPSMAKTSTIRILGAVLVLGFALSPALAARKLGARTVLGIDNDPGAVTNARHNARLNHVTQARFIVADVLRFKPSARFEVVTANLFSELLIAALPVFRRALRPQGLLIASGILREQTDAVLNALDRAGFELGKKRRRGKWVALQALGKK